MLVSFFKSRCLICWKRFEVPRFKDSHHELYYNQSTNSFSRFSWDDKKEICINIDNFISANSDIQILNDNTKGNTVRQLVGLLANGSNEFVLGLNRCPRCGIKCNFISNTKHADREIRELVFDNFLRLNRHDRLLKLSELSKNKLRKAN